MNTREIVISKKTVYIIVLALVILVAVLLFAEKISIFGFGQSNNVSSANLAAGSQEKFAFLSGQGSQRSVGST